MNDMSSWFPFYSKRYFSSSLVSAAPRKHCLDNCFYGLRKVHLTHQWEVDAFSSLKGVFMNVCVQLRSFSLQEGAEKGLNFKDLLCLEAETATAQLPPARTVVAT